MALIVGRMRQWDRALGSHVSIRDSGVMQARAQRDMAPQRCVGGFVCCCLAVLISAYGFVSLLCCRCIRKHASLRCAVLWDGAVYLC
ncbi:hypothetical protein AOT81_06495 [Xylella fastidiosa]|nr:hypothetical protein AOT81_06495 [Xylella fastidiosa]RWA44582.1 hypothetical protein XfCFBP8356_05390 [Xylella fastidiosa subsp. sandyi]